MGEAKYYGHLELVNIFLRALKRAGIAVKFTEGFHPKPKVSFDDPLPIGLESEHENITVTVPVDVDAQSVVQALNGNLPAGLKVFRDESAPIRSDPKAPKASTYHVALHEGKFDSNALASFTRCSDFTIEIEDRKGKLKKIDLKDMVLDIDLIDSKHLQILLRSEPGKMLRPANVLSQVFNLPQNQIKQARIIKQRA